MRTNFERLTSGLDIYRDTLRLFIATRLRSAYGRGRWVDDGVVPALAFSQQDRFRRDIEQRKQQGILDRGPADAADVLDVHQFERVMRRSWELAFKIALKDQKKVLDWAKEVGEERNTWAHKPSGDLAAADVNRVLDSCARVLQLVDQAAAEKVEALRDAGSAPVSTPPAVTAAPAPAPFVATTSPEAVVPPQPEPQPVVSAPRAVSTTTQSASTNESGTAAVKGLPAWRQVIEPHRDVAEGRYQQAEFAADLAQVLEGTAEAEYQDPVEFFRRTFLTSGMQRLLVAALERLRG